MGALLKLIQKLYGKNALSRTIGTRTNVIRLPSNKLKKYTPIVGYSDHSDTDLASLISVSLGAKIIEKHFILNKNIKSPDKSFSYTIIFIYFTIF